MKLSEKFIVFILILANIVVRCPAKAYSQYDKVWAFGDSAGIDFNTIPPKQLKTSIATNEGSASISDARGNLLFYTDGATIWDRTHKPMVNGADLPGVGRNITSSSSQGALIVPIPGRSSEYYVFSLGSFESGLSGRLYYSIVDMKQNNGLGGCVAETKSKLLAQDLTEQMTAIYGSHCNIWLVVASWLKPEIRAYNITFGGLDTVPVISTQIMGGGIYSGVIGTVDASPDRSKIAFSHGNLVLYDFDPANGMASNPLVLERKVDPNFYGVCFSPDNSKLYASAEGGNGGVFQFDLSLKDTLSIIKSRTQLVSNRGYAIKRAPDNKIYIADLGPTLSVIHKPNVAGLACDYRAKEFKLEGRCIYGLPNAATIVVNKKHYTSRTDSVICADSTILQARMQNGINYQWQDGSRGNTLTTDTSGTYWVAYQHYDTECVEYVDTIHLVFHKNVRRYSRTVADAQCRADTLLLQAKNTSATEYFWENQDPGPERVVRTAGIYWVQYRIDSVCALHVDTFDVRYNSYRLSFYLDTLYCLGTPIHFQNTSDQPFNRFYWYYGNGEGSAEGNPRYPYARAGRYEVKLLGWIDGRCTDSVMTYITVDLVFLVHYRPDKKAICQGEMIRFFPETDENVKALYWNYGTGDHLLTADKSPVQHAFPQAGIYPVTLNALNRVCPATQFADTIIVQALPAVYLGADSSLCWQGQPIVLENKSVLAVGTYRYLWNTGATTPGITALHHGTYWLKVTSDSLGCTNMETIDVAKDCYIDIPNVFTPNGDGYNDYFFPRRMLSASLSQFTMQIHNRWGQVVFETHSPNSMGWDGRFNDNMLPQGVYVYRITAHFQKDQPIYYEGNVTLIR